MSKRSSSRSINTPEAALGKRNYFLNRPYGVGEGRHKRTKHEAAVPLTCCSEQVATLGNVLKSLEVACSMQQHEFGLENKPPFKHWRMVGDGCAGPP